MYVALCGMVLAARLPWGLQRRLGRVIGAMALRLVGTRRCAAEINLQLCFPTHNEAWRKKLLHENFDALGVGLFRFARAWWEAST